MRKEYTQYGYTLPYSLYIMSTLVPRLKKKHLHLNKLHILRKMI